MKFAIVGAGAIGGYLGARLSAAGEDVTFIARNRNLQAIRTDGFRLLLEDGSTLHAPAARAVQDPAEAGPQDAVLLTVKAHQVVDLLPQLRELFGPRTSVVSMINGVPWWYFHRLAGPYEGRRLESVDPWCSPAWCGCWRATASRWGSQMAGAASASKPCPGR